nr:hypothetical protein [Candidatus Sigynarchaeota archaeon]
MTHRNKKQVACSRPFLFISMRAVARQVFRDFLSNIHGHNCSAGGMLKSSFIAGHQRINNPPDEIGDVTRGEVQHPV